MDATATTTPTAQQTIPTVRSVTTSDRRFTIHWPLPKQHNKPREISARPGSRLSAMLARINTLLNAGWPMVCPVSGKLIKVYRRGLHQSQVNTLRRLMEKSDKLGIAYLHVEFFSARRDGDLAKLALWGLIERLRTESKYEQEKATGKWRITDRGRAFLAGTVRIPRQVAVLEGERLGYVDESDTMSVDEVQQTFDKEVLAEGNDGKHAEQPAEAACP